jgi:hypothetical protein
MDEAGVRALLARVADDPAPPSRVDIAAARQRGRRRIRRHRAALAAAPLAAAAAVAVVLSGVIPASLGHGRGSRQPGPPAPRSRFNPVVPYAAFGWLPAGFTTPAGTGMGGTDQTSTLSATLTVGDRATGRMLTLIVSAAGACRLTGPQRDQVLVKHGLRARFVTVTYPHGLICRDGIGNTDKIPLPEVAPAVRGGTAFYLIGGGLAWEYARDSWAQLAPGTTIVGMTPQRAHQAAAGWESAPASQGFPATVQSAATRALLHKIAGWVRYGARAPIVFPFQLAALPTGWAVSSVTYGVAYGLRVGTVNLAAGPTSFPAALNVQVQEATEQKHCSGPPAGAQVVSVHGAPAYLYANPPRHQPQEIYACHVAGLGFTIQLDRTLAGSHRPVPGLASLGGVLRVARGMRLLGPDRDAWTAHPVH